MNRRTWFILGVVGVVLAGGGYAGWQAWAQSQTPAAAITTAPVTRITAVISFDASGTVEPAQAAALFWPTAGQVKTVNVKVGDTVNAGDVLMTLDPALSPAAQAAAQADLLAAQLALQTLQRPADPVALANANKAVIDAQTALDLVRRTLRAVQQPALPALDGAVADAKLALDTAQANVQLTRASADGTAMQQAVNNKNLAYGQLQSAQAAYDACAKITCAEHDQRLSDLTDAKNSYQAALDALSTAQLKYQSAMANGNDSVAKAQVKYDWAVANLAYAQRGPAPDRLRLAEANVAAAEATLAAAQAAVDKLKQGPAPLEIALATARVQAAQAALSTPVLVAPFGGQVTAVNDQPGDMPAQSQAAIELANRSILHVLIQVNEADISRLKINDAVTVTVKPWSDRTLVGKIAEINPRGANVKGLIKYTVQVNFTEADPALLLGMTANVTVVTDVRPNVLAVPLDAVQTDGQGEYVNRLTPAGAVERVSVVSSALQGVNVVVTGNLQPGDQVVLGAPPAAPASNPFNLLAPGGGGGGSNN